MTKLFPRPEGALTLEEFNKHLKNWGNIRVYPITSHNSYPKPIAYRDGADFSQPWNEGTDAEYWNLVHNTTNDNYLFRDIHHADEYARFVDQWHWENNRKC